MILIHLTPFYELMYLAGESAEVKCCPAEDCCKTAGFSL